MTTDTYTRTFTLTAALRGKPLRVVSKAGLAGGDIVSGPTALAAELITPGPTETTLLLGCGHGALGVALARQLPAARLTLSDPSVLALRMARLTLAATGVEGVSVSARVSQLPAGAGSFDRVI
ncbi:MAG: methyltransferase, partial [Chloroflexales bacterium]|nr:methyltransferase [Chloroflexales bacterium]